MGGPRRRRRSGRPRRRPAIGLVGGIIHRDAETGRRTSRALVFDRRRRARRHLREAAPPRRAGLLGDPPLRAGHGGAAPDRRVRPADRRADLLRHQPARGYAPARRAGRGGRPHPAGQRGEDVPALEDRLPRQRADSACYVLSVNRPDPGAGRADRRPVDRGRSRRQCLVETTDPLALVTLDAETIRKARSPTRATCPSGRRSTRTRGARSRRETERRLLRQLEAALGEQLRGAALAPVGAEHEVAGAPAVARRRRRRSGCRSGCTSRRPRQPDATGSVPTLRCWTMASSPLERILSTSSWYWSTPNGWGSEIEWQKVLPLAKVLVLSITSCVDWFRPRPKVSVPISSGVGLAVGSLLAERRNLGWGCPDARRGRR